MQGSDPKTNAFLFFAFQDTPANNDRSNQDTYSCQVIVSWPYRSGFLDRTEPVDVPVGYIERLRLMKHIAQGWASPFREAVLDIPEGTVVQSIRLEDWPPAANTWTNLDGGATLIGDAAHAMTMCKPSRPQLCLSHIKLMTNFCWQTAEKQQTTASPMSAAGWTITLRFSKHKDEAK